MIVTIAHFYGDIPRNARASVNGSRVSMAVLDALEMAGKPLEEKTERRRDGRVVFSATILLPWND